MKAILKGFGIQGEIEIEKVTPTIEFSLHRIFSFSQEYDLSQPSNIKVVFKFMKRESKHKVVYELEGWD